MSWFDDTLEWVGKAIPNEVSKLNSYSKYVQYIPIVGQILSVLTKAASAADNFATKYTDVKDQGGSTGDALGIAARGGVSGVRGVSQDPGIYGSPGDNINRDWANVAGQIGNYLPGDFSSQGLGKSAMGAKGAMNNPYFTKQEGDSIPVEYYKEDNYGGFVGDLIGGFAPNLRVNKPEEKDESEFMNTYGIEYNNDYGDVSGFQPFDIGLSVFDNPGIF